ncbi:MAG: aldehyde ferredoxin oxidoreductase N-terminal domain-containing protein [Candidatus Woesearchaeota archaeon]
MKDRIATIKIDVSKRQTSLEETPSKDLPLEEKLGGFGKSTNDIQEHLKQNPDLRDAYDERNMLCLDIGCFTGSRIATSKRTIISGLSPLKTSKAGNNGIYYSAASGGLGPKIRDCNLDAIRIIGKSEEPTYIVIDNGQVSFENASELVGKTTDEKITMLATKHEKAVFAVIGPAGENRARLANIAFSTNDQVKNKSRHMRFAGRGGMGAVMGSKNLLAIVARGKRNWQEVGDVKKLNLEIAKGDKTKKYREQGTFFGNFAKMERLGVGIHNNFSKGYDPKTEALLKENLIEAGYEIKDKGCLGCPIRCWKELRKDGTVFGKIDFEPTELLGPNLGISNIEEIAQLINLSDSLGIDSISAGVCLGYEMENQGTFSDFEFAKKLLEEIGNGTHPLKEGVMRYSNSAPNAMQVKGIEMAAYPGSLNPGYAFAIAGPHMSIDTYNRAWYPNATNSVEEWVENIFRGSNMILYDMHGLCKFAKAGFEDVAKLYENIYGEKITANDLKETARKVNLRARMIDFSLGFTEDDDVLPENCFNDYGSAVRHFNTKEFFEEVKKGVYEKFKDIKL